MTPAHHSADFAELVCSNSLRGDRLENAVGLLKEELRRGREPDPDAAPRRRGSRLAAAWQSTATAFPALVTEKIRDAPEYDRLISGEVTEVPSAAGDHRDGAR